MHAGAGLALNSRERLGVLLATERAKHHRRAIVPDWPDRWRDVNTPASHAGAQSSEAVPGLAPARFHNIGREVRVAVDVPELRRYPRAHLEP